MVLGEQHGAGVKMGTRCIWDAEADTYAYDSFLNVRIAQLIYILLFNALLPYLIRNTQRYYSILLYFIK